MPASICMSDASHPLCSACFLCKPSSWCTALTQTIESGLPGSQVQVVTASTHAEAHAQRRRPSQSSKTCSRNAS